MKKNNTINPFQWWMLLLIFSTLLGVFFVLSIRNSRQYTLKRIDNKLVLHVGVFAPAGSRIAPGYPVFDLMPQGLTKKERKNEGSPKTSYYYYKRQFLVPSYIGVKNVEEKVVSFFLPVIEKELVHRRSVRHTRSLVNKLRKLKHLSEKTNKKLKKYSKELLLAPLKSTKDITDVVASFTKKVESLNARVAKLKSVNLRLSFVAKAEKALGHIEAALAYYKALTSPINTVEDINREMERFQQRVQSLKKQVLARKKSGRRAERVARWEKTVGNMEKAIAFYKSPYEKVTCQPVKPFTTAEEIPVVLASLQSHATKLKQELGKKKAVGQDTELVKKSEPVVDKLLKTLAFHKEPFEKVVCEKCKECPPQQPCPDCKKCPAQKPCPACPTCKACPPSKPCPACKACKKCKETVCAKCKKCPIQVPPSSKPTTQPSKK